MQSEELKKGELYEIPLLGCVRRIIDIDEQYVEWNTEDYRHYRAYDSGITKRTVFARLAKRVITEKGR